MEKVKLKKVLKNYKIKHMIQNDKTYRQVTISQTGEVSFRGEKHGADIGRKRQFMIDLRNHPNTLIFIRQGIMKGGIGVCPPEVDGCVVTENMPMFDIVNINPDYLLNFIKSPQFKEDVSKLVPIGTAQKALHEDKLLEIEIPLPSKNEQERIVQKIQSIENEIKQVVQNISHDKTLLTSLRSAILSEAVQGKLVPQNPNDEPASELLKKIKKEKEKLIKDGKIRKGKGLPAISEDEVPYELPKGWVWCRFNDLIDFVKKYPMKRGPFGSSIKKSFFVPKGENTYKVYEQYNAIYNDMNFGRYYVNQDKFNELKAFEVEPGDLIISCSGTIGKIGFLPEKIEKGIINQALLKICINENILLKKYFTMLFESYIMNTDKLTDLKGTAIKNIPGVNVLKMMPIPLPPISEQKRIVEKVDSLMKLCDELEGKIKENKKESEVLMNVVLKESFNSS